MLKKLLQDAILRGYALKENAPVYLQFSAGCDSTALLLSMIELDRPFTCIAYIFEQPKSFLNKIKGITTIFNIPIQIFELTDKDVINNMEKLRRQGFNGKVLLDCLAGHVPIIETLEDSIVVNSSYADVLYGSYFYHFKSGMPQSEFNAKRMKMLNTYDQDGVNSLSKLLGERDNLLLVPFGDEEVIKYFMSKSLDECGGINKTLFRKEFADELEKLPYKIIRKAQQIESGIRDFRKNYKPHSTFF